MLAAMVFHQTPPMALQTYEYLCGLIHRHSRIHLGPNKVSLLTGRLSRRKLELGLATWEDYADWLNQHPAEEIDILIDLVSTNHTHFFREAVHFEMLQTQLLDQLIANSPTARNGLRCWSAASSSGEEPFTLAIVLSEYAEHKHPGLRWQIEATDISNRALQKAEQAVYEADRLNLPNPAFLYKYFQRGSGPYEGFCKVKSELQKRVHFRRMNLFGEAFSMLDGQHVIFCRNVLIYFKVESQVQLVQRLHDVIEPGGYLIVGHSDSLMQIKHAFKSLGNGVYQREQ
jgi:chemotaxis protein methyltransferase CheR